MTTATPNLGLVLYDEVDDASKYFLEFRKDLSGTEESNMTKLDDFAGRVNDKINELETTSKIQDNSGSTYRLGKDEVGFFIRLEV